MNQAFAPMDQACPKARVFISSGQRRCTQEERIAEEISQKLKNLGFDPYVAVAQQNLNGVKEAIFKKIADSEYFLFIDFRREQLAKKNDCRGSLFSHQELAIASYLNLEAILFHEKGVEREAGVMQFLQGNSKQFEDRDSLPELIEQEIKARNWNPNWQSRLELFRNDCSKFIDARNAALEGRPLGRYFHVDVKNWHKDKPAFNCNVYLVRLFDCQVQAERQLETVEYKWRGALSPSVAIMPGQNRAFDALWVLHNSPQQIQFNPHTDWTGAIPRIDKPGSYLLTYCVVSENFPIAQREFRLNVGSTLEEMQFVESR